MEQINYEKVKKYIVNWLENYLHTSKTKGFVVGVSGGIDSAVVSTLCAETKMPVLCLEMPIHQEKNQVSRAKNHIAFLKEKYPNVQNLEVNLTSVFDTFTKQIPSTSINNDLPLANTRSRLRMTTLYYFAGLHNYVVAGTGNKIEDFGVGFFTKYGDGGVDISPIAHLLKSQVYALANILGISQEIQQAKPTDGLFGDDRSDEDQLGASYNELEWAMQQYDEGKNASDFTGRQQEVFQIYKRLHTNNQHKMTPIPVCTIPFELMK